MNIRTKLVSILFAVSMLPMIISNGIFFFYEKENVTAEFINHLKSVASIQQARVDSIYHQNLERLGLVASRTQLRLSLDAFNHTRKKIHQDKMTRILTDAKNAISDFKEICIYSLDGSLAASTRNDAMTPLCSLKNGILKHGSKTPALMFFRDDNQNLILLLAAPLHLDDRPLGILLIESKAESLLSSISDYTGLGKTGETVLASKNEQGDIVFLTPTRFDSNAALNVVIPKMRKNIPIAHAMEGKNRIFSEFLDYRDIPVLAVTHHIEGANWGLVVKMDSQEVFSNLNKLRDIFIAIIIVSFFMVAAISIYLSSAITSPVVNLTQAAKQIIKGNLQVSADETSKDEIGILGGTFNKMAASLQQMQRELEEKVTEQQEINLLLNNVLNSSPDLIFVKNTRLQTILSNEAFARTVGKSPEEMLGKTDIENGWLPELVYGNPAKGVRGFEQDDKTALGGKAVHNPYDPANVNGNIRIFDTHKLPLHNSAGDIIGILGVSRDISELLENQQKLKSLNTLMLGISKIESAFISDAKKNSLFEDMLALILELTESEYGFVGEVLYKRDGNPYLKTWAITNIARDDATRKFYDEYAPLGMEFHNLDTLFGAVMTSGAEVIANDPCHDSRRGGLPSGHPPLNAFLGVPIYAGMTMVGMMGVSNRPGGYDEKLVGFLQPLFKSFGTIISAYKAQDEKNAAEDALHHFQKMDAIGKLASGIAHDYNNVLGVISGYADLIALKYSHVEGLDKYIEQILQAGKQGKDLTQKLLDFSRHKNISPKATDLKSILDSQKELLRKAVTPLVNIEYRLCEPSWPIWIDPNELKNCLLNLSVNAKYAMPDGGTLTFMTENRHLFATEASLLGLDENDYAILSVKDNGCGIEDDVREKIFEPFFTTKEKEGTGLGLSQAYNFMEKSGGQITVESRPGAGCEFLLYFPRYLGEIPDDGDGEKVHATAGSLDDGLKILVVDDETGLRALTKEILEMADYRVITACDAESALEVLKTESIVLLISDIIMPKMNGYQLAKMVKEQYPNIKIQLVSGFSSDENNTFPPSEALYCNIMHKPYTSTELLTRVAELLNGTKDEQHQK